MCLARSIEVTYPKGNIAELPVLAHLVERLERLPLEVCVLPQQRRHLHVLDNLGVVVIVGLHNVVSAVFTRHQSGGRGRIVRSS
jgi:hypothetical protein